MASRNSKGRMIYWKISYCKQLIKVSLLSKLLFTWLIPNTDNLGRMEGDPAVLKGMIFPYEDEVNLKQIEESLKELAIEYLIMWYSIGGNWYIQFPKWGKYQFLEKNHTKKSDYPEPLRELVDKYNAYFSQIEECTDMYLHVSDMSPVKENRRRIEGEGEKKKDYSLEFEKFRQRYSDFLDLIDKYFEILRTTRRSGKISDSVVLQVYVEMNKYSVVVVKYACSTVIGKPDLHSKKENYFYGIMRNTDADEAEKKLKPKEGDRSNEINTGDNKQSKFAGIDKSKFLTKPKN